jgi:hypothetical protein
MYLLGSYLRVSHHQHIVETDASHWLHKDIWFRYMYGISYFLIVFRLLYMHVFCFQYQNPEKTRRDVISAVKQYRGLCANLEPFGMYFHLIFNSGFFFCQRLENPYCIVFFLFCNCWRYAEYSHWKMPALLFFTDLLTSWYTAFWEAYGHSPSQEVKSFKETRKFITMLTRVCCWTLFWEIQLIKTLTRILMRSVGTKYRGQSFRKIR